jgi:hypothetical protein
MLKLPDVTLVIAETRAHDLARRTINDLVSRVEFGGVLIYSDDCWRIDAPGANYVKVADWPDKVSSGLFYYTEAATRIKTSHALLMEWDAGLNDPAMWDDRFLDYDYIGAPWPSLAHARAHGSMNVGNGGFMLQSKRLIDFVYRNRDRFPVTTDMHISCHFRPAIEAEGNFKWAPADVAGRFAFEGWDGIPKLTTRPKSFGYHGLFHWKFMLSPDELRERSELVAANPFLCKTGKLNLLRQSMGPPREPVMVHPSYVLQQQRRRENARHYVLAQQRGLKA